MRFLYRNIGPLFPGYFGKLACETWFSTTRFRTPDREVPVMQSAGQLVLDVHGTPVRVYLWGDEHNNEKTVLFAHGWSGRGTQAHAFVEAWPEAELVITGGLGHHRILRDDAVVRRAVDFLKQ